jgi:hypothetical protein
MQRPWKCGEDALRPRVHWEGGDRLFVHDQDLGLLNDEG